MLSKTGSMYEPPKLPYSSLVILAYTKLLEVLQIKKCPSQHKLNARTGPTNRSIHKLSILLVFTHIFTSEVQDAVSIIHQWGMYKGSLLSSFNSEFPLLLGHEKNYKLNHYNEHT